MSSLEARIQAIEDRLALESVLDRYCNAVDTLSDMAALLSCFTPDAIYDLGGIGLQKFHGHEGIKGFFSQVFADMTHHAHLSTNFVVERLEGDTAAAHAYIIGMGIARDGKHIHVYVKYMLNFRRTADGWKIDHYRMAAMMPMSSTLTEVHAKNKA